MINSHLKISNEASSRNLKIQEMQKISLKDEILFMKSSKWSLTLLDTLNDYFARKTTYSPNYPENEKLFFKLPKN